MKKAIARSLSMLLLLCIMGGLLTVAAAEPYTYTIDDVSVKG